VWQKKEIHLFDHLVSAGEQCRRHGQAERGGGLQIDGEVDMVGCSIGMPVGAAPDGRRGLTAGCRSAPNN
jgi:hypothetical protein